ncbi:MAG: carboxypeptidase regulatory-like domain-containing protein [Acidobacteriota bacterium]|nr:carboxypeptidase regulatory-like domain-containing protein [Acidobacteriota bacterium]
MGSFLLCSFAALAQVSSGTLVGTVLDATGSVVPNAKIEATNTATGVAASTVATGAGEYRIGGLLAGTYKATATATGFTGSTLQNIAIDANKTVTANFSLAVGSVATSVEVTTDSAAVIDTTTATIQTTFDTQMVRDLPVSGVGLGVANLSLLGAGVASNGGIGAGEGPSVGGQRPRNNNFMIEGVDANNKTVTGSLIRTMPNDAVSEFTILQNQEGAQYGHSSGGQFNTILKSGTNSFHGTAYEYLQNRNLNAIDQVVQNQAISAGEIPSNPRSDSNRFGGSFGGPILKNKLFFFGLYEYNPVGASATPSAISAPTAQGYSILSGISGLSSTNLAILKQYLPAAVNAVPSEALKFGNTTIPVGDLQVISPNYQNNQSTVETFDYNMSDKDQLRGRYIYNRLSQVDVQASLPAFFTFANNVYHVASLAEYHNFSPTLTNELRLGFNRFNQPVNAGNFKYPGLDSFPNITIDDLGGVNIGPDPNGPQTTIQNTYQLTDSVTWVKGAHTFQIGFDGRRSISPQTFTQRSRGDYDYSNLEGFLRDVTPDQLAQRSLGNPVYYGDQYATYEFVQDTWRLRPNLTLNLGLRYEYTTIPVGEKNQILNSISSVPGFLTFGIPKAQNKNFAPRVGFAYSPGTDGKTSIRAGFGMAYDVLYDNIGILSLPPQLSTTADVTNINGNPLGGAPNFLANGGIKPNVTVSTALSAADARANTSAYVPDQKLPYSIQWNLGIQHVFANNYTFEARYLGTRGVHLDVQDRINKRTIVTATNSLPTYLTAPSQATLDALPITLASLQSVSNILPAFAANGFTNGGFVEDAPIGWSTYNGLALQLNRRFSNGLQFQGAYTWSHLIDNSTADFFTTYLTPRRPEDFQNMSAERSSSALDRRHRFTFAAYYESTWLNHSNWLLKNIVGNWTLAPIYTYESPELATVQSAVDSNLNGDSAGDRVIINPAGQDGVGSSVTPLKNSAGATVAYVAVNPNARYIKAGSGAYANGGRNTLPGRPIDNIDMNVFKNFSYGERYKMQFSATFFNLLNHAQFIPGFPGRADNPNVLNTGGAIRNYLTPGNAIFNNPEAIFSSNPRNIQVSAKLIF